jgi:hypothetical protein
MLTDELKSGKLSVLTGTLFYVIHDVLRYCALLVRECRAVECRVEDIAMVPNLIHR